MYFFLDPEKVGEENVVAGLIAFVSLLNICEFPHLDKSRRELTR